MIPTQNIGCSEKKKKKCDNIEWFLWGAALTARAVASSSGSSSPTPGYECRGLVLKLHLQKHYLLKNYTSRDLEIVLDANENYVELLPKDDPDALRMLRHADAQASRSRRRCRFFSAHILSH